MPSSASSIRSLSNLSLHDALPILAVRRARLQSGLRSLRDRLQGRPPGEGRDRAALRPRRAQAPRRPGVATAAAVHLGAALRRARKRSEEHTSELQSLRHLVCRLLLRPYAHYPIFPYTTLFRSWLSDERGFNQGFDHFETVYKDAHPEKGVTGPLSVRAARKLLVDLESRPQPLFIWVQLFDAHEKDRKSTRLNSSHLGISYAVFCFVHTLTIQSFPTRRSSDLGCPTSAASIRASITSRPSTRTPTRRRA